jgi:hypothetical protein
MKFLVIMVLAGGMCANSAQAFDPQIFAPSMAGEHVFNGHAQRCFSHAMVGMDSVINSRLGVPPENVVALAEKAVTTANPDATFDEPILVLMLAAYLWEGSPHSYAIKVFYDCASAAPLLAGRSDFSP